MSRGRTPALQSHKLGSSLALPFSICVSSGETQPHPRASVSWSVKRGALLVESVRIKREEMMWEETGTETMLDESCLVFWFTDS